VPFIAAGIFFVILILTALLTGDAIWAVPIVIVAILVLGYFALNRRLSEREISRHGGDTEAALSDNEEGGLPKTHLVTDDDSPLGDTREAHDEINPHDIPKGSPTRQTAEALAADREEEQVQREAPGGPASGG
jgi:hypothetical protein